MAITLTKTYLQENTIRLSVIADGSATGNLEVGFTPSKVEITRKDTGMKFLSTNGADKALKIAIDDGSVVVTQETDIVTYTGGTIAVGTDADINVNEKTMIIDCFR